MVCIISGLVVSKSKTVVSSRSYDFRDNEAEFCDFIIPNEQYEVYMFIIIYNSILYSNIYHMFIDMYYMTLGRHAESCLRNIW